MITESKLSIAIVTADESYVRTFSEALRKDKDIVISSFSSSKKLMDSNMFFQIIFADEAVFEEGLVSRCISLIMLSEDVENAKETEGVKCIDKYKRVDSLYRFALSDYAEKKQKSLDSKRAYVKAVYSPAGGCGVSTIALTLAFRAARLGLKTLYLNLEDVPTQGFLIQDEAGAKGISALAAALDEKIDMNAKIGSLLQKKEEDLYCFGGWENLSDVRAMNAEDIEKLITVLSDNGNFDFIVIDMENSLTDKTIKIFDLADEILMVSTDADTALYKMNALLSNQFIANSFLRKIKVVVNKYQNGREIELPISEFGTIPELTQMSTGQIVSYLSVSQDFSYLASMLK